MLWNRDLDETEVIVKNKLGISKKSIIGLKAIYEFISRFAGINYKTNYSVIDLKMLHKGDMQQIPPMTKKIISGIGLDNLNLYFSSMAYPKKFLPFCKKLQADNFVKISDYLADGLIIFDPIEVEISTFKEEDIPV